MMTREYEHLFFDLDRTLWDFETNAHLTLTDAYTKFKLAEKGISSPDVFIESYKVINEQMWTEYRLGKISKVELRTERYYMTLKKFNIADKVLSTELGDYYITECPTKTNLLPGTIETLDYLKSKYQLHIITNGFEEVQHIKLKHSGLDNYFDKVITSEGAGAKKPSQKVFLFALQQTQAKRKNSLMIGDDFPVDIVGAKKTGIHQVYFNPNSLHFEYKKKPTYQIKHLNELKSIL